MGNIKLSNIWNKLFVSISAVIVLTSCAVGPGFQEYSEQLSPLSDNQTRLYIYRPESSASAVNPDIKIDGRTVGRVPAKGFLVLKARSGGHVLTTSANPRKATSIFVRKGTETYIRLDVKQGFSVNEVKARNVDPDVGRSEIVNTTYAGK